MLKSVHGVVMQGPEAFVPFNSWAVIGFELRKIIKSTINLIDPGTRVTADNKSYINKKYMTYLCSPS